jgi:SAM-dependent methyltransferase
MDSECYDGVVSVATLHHLPLTPTLERMKSLVRPGGVLLIHDVRAPAGKRDWLRSGLAAGLNGDAVWWLRNRLRAKPALRAAWRDHGADERYLTMEQVRALCETTLPGAKSYRHPLWRYTVVWTRGRDAACLTRR